MDKEVVISLENVSKSFDKELSLKSMLKIITGSISNNDLILSNISLQIKKGEFIAIVGNNGAGKSTLLKLISGVLSPDSGSIYTNGEIHAIHELTSGFNQELNGYENLELLATLQGIPKNEFLEKLNDVISFSELSHNALNKAIKYYSSGMKTRLAYAFSITFVKDILLLDEVLAVGDYNFIQKCIVQLKLLIERGVTIILVTHVVSRVEDLITKIYEVSNNQIRLINLEDYMINLNDVNGAIFFIDSSIKLDSIRAIGEKFEQEINEAHFKKEKAFTIKLFKEENINFRFNLSNNSKPSTVNFYATISIENKYLALYESIDYLFEKGQQVVDFNIKVPELSKGLYKLNLTISEDKKMILKSSFKIQSFAEPRIRNFKSIINRNVLIN